MFESILIVVISCLISASAQVLLKKSSLIERQVKIKEYLNLYVIIGYGMTFISMLLMIVAYKRLPLKYGTVLESLAYVYILILSKVFLGEKITTNKVLGNLLIITGIMVFTVFGGE